jgi:protein-S-isoprenylcysteine O-methyltransferase Ste14
MSLERTLDWLPLVTLVAMMTAGKLQALVMHRRGLRVTIVDWHRPIKELLYDTLMIGVAIWWIYLLVAEVWPLSLAWLPGWLTKKPVSWLPVRLLGAAFTLAAPVLYAAALRSMGTSWRIGIDQKQSGPLVTSGLFTWTRNPIYAAMDLLLIGAFLIHGRVVSLLASGALVLLVHGIVLREERFLREHYGDAFGAYRQSVRRYGPI